jgi:signal transduction histidine kinase
MVDGAGGEDFLCEVSGRAIRQGQEALHVLAFDDITEKHRYEENILRLNAGLEKRVDERTHELSEALEHLKSAQSELVRSEKMSALGSLVAGIAHELNTPIGNSLTVATTLDDMCATFEVEVAKGLTRSRLGEFVANTRNGAGILVRGLSHAAELVASFKQVAVDQTSLKRRQFSLKEMLAEILVTLGPGLRKTTHTVHLEVAGDINMDSYPGPLGQVVTNLVNNAVIHGFEGRKVGNIFIDARMLREGWVVVTFKDDGLGISPESLGKVFDPFFTTKLGKGGSGLGLNIVYNLVTNSLGGTITVESSPGEGACFRIALPLTGPDTNPNFAA